MNKLDAIKDTGVKEYLEGVHFNFNKSDQSPLGPHIHYTTNAASLLDEALLFKSLTQKETEILKNLKTKEKKEETMDEQVLKDITAKMDLLVAANEKAEKENVELKKQLKTDGIVSDLKDFSLENEAEVVKALMPIEDRTEVMKAFKFLKDQVKVKVEDTDIQKQLDTESGSDANATVVEKSLDDQIIEMRKKEAK